MVEKQNKLPSFDVSDGSSMQINSVNLEASIVESPSPGATEESPRLISSSADGDVGLVSSLVEVSDSQVRESANERGNVSQWLDYATLMGNTLPSKSKIVYMKAYGELENYLRKENQFINGVVPSEHAMLNFFHHLKNDRQQAPSTIWFFFLFNITLQLSD